MTANGTFAVHSLDHARLSARKFAQQHLFPHISAAFPIQRARMFLLSAIHDKPPRGAGPRRAAFSRNRRKQMHAPAEGHRASTDFGDATARNDGELVMETANARKHHRPAPQVAWRLSYGNAKAGIVNYGPLISGNLKQQTA